jgi:hypothetical protein
LSRKATSTPFGAITKQYPLSTKTKQTDYVRIRHGAVKGASVPNCSLVPPSLFRPNKRLLGDVDESEEVESLRPSLNPSKLEKRFTDNQCMT